LCKTLIGRSDVQDKVVTYLKDCLSRETTVVDNVGKFTVLGASGVKGIGKSEIEGRICAGWAKMALGENAKTIYVTYNGGGAANSYCTDKMQILRNGGYGNSFGHLLLVACGIPEEVAIQVPILRALSYVREKLGCEEAPLVICVDEVIELDRGEVATEVNTEVESTWPPSSRCMSALMKLQDQEKGKLIFVFTGILDSMFVTLKSLSGRSVDTLPLSLLPLSDVFEHIISPTLKKLAKAQPAVHQLVLSCAGHPRATTDGLSSATASWKEDETISTAALIAARTRIVSVSSKFDTTYLTEDILHRWFELSAVSVELKSQLLSKGILQSLENGVEFLFPLLLQQWAHDNAQTTYGHHLGALFEADLILDSDSEKHMEAVMFHYEAVLRKSMNGKTFSLSDLYKSKHIGETFKDRVVSAPVPPNTVSLVRFMANFNDIDETLRLLRSGFVVVSKAHSEAGVEYLAPYYEDKALVVACVQCKFVKAGTNWKEIKTAMAMAVSGLEKRTVQHFPVVYTTADQKSTSKKTYDDGVYFIEKDIFAFTSKVGVLRLHTQKLGAVLAGQYPFLQGSTL
jgi:hypothetical protein